MRSGSTLAGLLAIALASPDRCPGADRLPASISAEGVPPIPAGLEREMARYRFSSSASFQGWLAGRRKVLYTNQSGGTQQVFVVEEPGGDPRQLTRLDAPVAWAVPSPTGDRFVFAVDNGGDENNHLFLVDLDAERPTPFTNRAWKSEDALWSRSGRSLALSSNARNGKDMDLYVVRPPDAASGRRLREATGYLDAWDWSPDDRRIAAVEYAPNFRSTRVHLIDVATGSGEVVPVPPGPPSTTDGVRWSGDGGSLTWRTDRGSEFTHLARYDLATGRETSLTASIPWDIDEFDLSDDGSTIVLIANEDGRSVLHVLDARTGEAKPTPRLAEGMISSLSFRPKSLEFAFRWGCSRSPYGIFSYDLASGRGAEWIKPTALDPKAGSVGEPEVVRFASFDGRMIPALVRRPAPRFPGRRPVLIDIHGGPAAQGRPEPSYLDDYLIGELGIAIVAPNVRGSTGYGRAYEKLDDGPLREDAVRDVGALLDWIEGEPDLDASRVAVSGGSYGGYMALAALARYGERLRAGIDWMGVSDFETFLKAASPVAVDAFRDEFGDERDPKVRGFFGRISPRANARSIRKPLLVVHGANDSRVNVEESRQIVAAVRGNGSPVWSIRFDGEGHGIERREHQVYFHHAQVVFLERFLLGDE